MPSQPTLHHPHRVRQRKSWDKGFVKQKRLVGRALQKRNRRIKLRDQFTCRDCGYIFTEDKLQVDHIVPVAEGGSDEDENCQTLCLDCHDLKTLSEHNSSSGLEQIAIK